MVEQTTLSNLGEAMGMAVAANATAAAVPAKPKIDTKGRAYATGRRKNAIARVWLKRGTGKVTVNGKIIEAYFARPVLRMLVQQPLIAVNRNTQMDVECTVVGGGLSGQAGAVRHGISRALTYFEPDLRPALKKGGFLTRDSRAVERKKKAGENSGLFLFCREKGKPGQGRPGLPSKPAIAGEGKNRLASAHKDRNDFADCESP